MTYNSSMDIIPLDRNEEVVTYTTYCWGGVQYDPTLTEEERSAAIAAFEVGDSETGSSIIKLAHERAIKEGKMLPSGSIKVFDSNNG